MEELTSQEPQSSPDSKKLEVVSKQKQKVDGILREKRGKYNGPLVTAETYNEFLDQSPISGDVSLSEALEIRKFRRKEANRKRSFANRYLKAYLKGKSRIQLGVIKDENGVKQPNIVTISSNEYDLYKKVPGVRRDRS